MEKKIDLRGWSLHATLPNDWTASKVEKYIKKKNKEDKDFQYIATPRWDSGGMERKGWLVYSRLRKAIMTRVIC